MNNPQVEYLVFRPRKLHSSEGCSNSVTVVINTKSEDFFENPITGDRTFTGRSNTFSPPIFFDIKLNGTSHDHILSLLHNQLNCSHDWLCTDLASYISVTATDLGFGHNGFTVDIFIKITYHNVLDLSDPSINHEELSLKSKILRTVLLGRIKRESLESLKTETESCSICLNDLSDSSKDGEPTRMNCSHVFHSNCLLEWLHRKNTCPLCRTVLYDQ